MTKCFSFRMLGGSQPFSSWGKGVRVFEMETVLFQRAWELTSTHATMVATMARTPETMSTKPSVALWGWPWAGMFWLHAG